MVNGNYLLTGGGDDNVATAWGYLYEVTPSGQEVWHQQYASGSAPKDFFFKSIQLPDGSIISSGLAENNTTGGNAGWLVKTDAQGTVIWNRVYDKNENTDLFYSVLLTNDNGFLLSGQARNAETNSQDAWLLKVDSVGCPYPNCTVGIDEAEPTKVVVDVWPNPVAAQLNIEWQKSETATLQLHDLSGRVVLSQLGGLQSIEQLNVTALSDGLYVLHLRQGNSVVNIRLVIQH